MKLRPFKLPPARTGSVLILVLWIALGLLAIALYFANSMTYEYAASDNRASGLAADQAIEGGARYAAYVLANYATNGAVPATSEYQAADVPVGDAHFWIIGRNPDGTPSSEPYFGLMDEGSKFNLNTTTANTLSYLPNMTVDFADAIVDWRSTNGAGAYGLNYSSLGYEDKNSPFETVDELRLVYGATMDLLEGDDLNDNGALDANETPLNGGNVSTPGLFDYVTVYSREPNFHSDGSSPTNVNTASRAQLQALLSGAGVGNAGGLGERLFRDRTSSGPAAGMLAFCIRCREAGMSRADFDKIYDDITTSRGSYIYGRVNVNTAGPAVLEALFMGHGVDQSTALGAAQSAVTYRKENPSNLGSIAWLTDALGTSSPAVQALAGGDYITAHSFQFTADIAAVGPFGRGYRRVKFIFDTSDGVPKVIYRQDLGGLGWALGGKLRETLVAER